MSDPRNNGDLSGQRADLTGQRDADLGQAPPPHDPLRTEPPANSGGFEANQPTIVTLLYLAGVITGITAIVGVVLAYIWKSNPHAEWETSHYDYLIRTFWIGLIGSIVGAVLTVVLIGVLILVAVAVQVLIRTIFSLIAAQKRAPMPNPDSWTI
ncbi:DUF4870 family protein [Altererythrobacter sp. CAU 1778]